MDTLSLQIAELRSTIVILAGLILILLAFIAYYLMRLLTIATAYHRQQIRSKQP